MSAKGLIFDIKQMSVFDGPGIRTAVFLKGCPLRCQWCHNPEGLRMIPELVVSQNGCLNCGKCRQVCESPLDCTLCGKCTRVCPRGLRRIAGEYYTAENLAKFLLKDAEYLAAGEGGYTLSGGEPLMQGEFCVELLRRLRGNHRAIETCGYCSSDVFSAMLNEIDYVMFDIKLVNNTKHVKYTGVDNSLILCNLEILKKSDVPFVIRIPVIPGVNDDDENLRQTAELLAGSKKLAKSRTFAISYYGRSKI